MNDSKAEGVFDQAKGKLKQTLGEATNDQSLANSGAADQVKGHTEEAWGSVKDTAQNLKNSRAADEHRTEAHDTGNRLRDEVTGAFEHAKESIQQGLHNLEHKANRD